MFNSQLENYSLYRPVPDQDDYNQDIVTYELLAEIPAFFALTTAGNSFSKAAPPQMVMDCNYVGVTTSNKVEPGYKVGDYLVKYVVPAGSQFFFYCQRYE